MANGSTPGQTAVTNALLKQRGSGQPVNPLDVMMIEQYGTLGPPPQPLPSYLSQNVQNYIRTRPSYSESQPQMQSGLPPNDITGGEAPYTPNPQIGDIRRLFGNQVQQRFGPSAYMNPELMRKLMAMPGFSGFAGGDEI